MSTAVTEGSKELNPTREDFAALLSETLSKDDAFEGSVVKGIITAIEKDLAVIDVGLKMEGRVPVREFSIPGKPAELKVGDTVEVYLERIENALGEAVLSRDKARREESWTRLEEKFNAKEQVEGVIFNKVKGGFTVDLDGAVAFLPGSQVDVRPVRDIGPLMHSPQPFKILKMDRRRGNIVVSRREILEATRAEQRSEIVARLAEGQVIDGVVKNITDYGAFIDLGGIDGLLHVTDMAWRRVNHPSEIVNVGDTVKVQIVRINPETQRISLGMKQLQSDPWAGIEAKYPVGARFKGTVTNIADYGAFVELEPGVEGLIHVSEMSWTKKNIHPGKIVSTSQQVDVQILEVDAQKRRISLGLKQVQDNPWEVFLAAHPKGTQVEGPIRNITEFGLFVGLDGGVDGMVHLSDLDWNKSGDEAIKDYKKGDHRQSRGARRRCHQGAHQPRHQAGQRRPARYHRQDAQGQPGHLRGAGRPGERHRGQAGGHRHHHLHQALRSVARPLRAAARALQCRRQGGRRRHQPRQAQPPHHRVDQGAGDRGGEAGRGAIRLLRLGCLARRHLQGRHQEEGRRRGEERRRRGRPELRPTSLAEIPIASREAGALPASREHDWILAGEGEQARVLIPPPARCKGPRGGGHTREASPHGIRDRNRA